MFVCDIFNAICFCLLIMATYTRTINNSKLRQLTHDMVVTQFIAKTHLLGRGFPPELKNNPLLYHRVYLEQLEC